MFHKGPVAANGACQKWNILKIAEMPALATDIMKNPSAPKVLKIASYKGLKTAKNLFP
jgi:hypothetical protein